MNTAKAFEIAGAVLVRKYGEIGAGVSIVCWQAPKADRTTRPSAEETRVYPQVNLRCTPPASDEDGGATLYSDLTVLMASKVDDDLDHAVIAKIYAGVQDTFDRLYAAARGSTADAIVLTDFTAEVAKEIASGLNIGGVTFQAALSPYDDDGVNIIGFTVRIHYSRDDF